jgi:hypothetical protein
VYLSDIGSGCGFASRASYLQTHQLAYDLRFDETHRLMATCIQFPQVIRWIALMAILAGCQHASVPRPAVAASSDRDTSDLVERGEYIVRNVEERARPRISVNRT